MLGTHIAKDLGPAFKSIDHCGGNNTERVNANTSKRSSNRGMPRVHETVKSEKIS